MPGKSDLIMVIHDNWTLLVIDTVFKVVINVNCDYAINEQIKAEVHNFLCES